MNLKDSFGSDLQSRSGCLVKDTLSEGADADLLVDRARQHGNRAAHDRRNLPHGKPASTRSHESAVGTSSPFTSCMISRILISFRRIPSMSCSGGMAVTTLLLRGFLRSK